jgi:hypothetical protein
MRKYVFVANKEATEPRVPSRYVYFIILKASRSPSWFGLPLRRKCVTTDHGYVPFFVITIRSFSHLWLIKGGSFSHSWLNMGCATRGILTNATHGAGAAYPSGAPEFTPGFNGVRVTRSLVLYVCFVDRCLSICPFSFGHCVVCSSSIPITPLLSSSSSYIQKIASNS